MYPVVIGNGRSTTSDTIIGGYHVPKGVREKNYFWFKFYRCRSVQYNCVNETIQNRILTVYN